MAVTDSSPRQKTNKRNEPGLLFNKVSYRCGVIEGLIIYTMGRLGALITPTVFPGWIYVAAPFLFLLLQYLIAPVWATRRIRSTRRERLSKRFWLLGPLLASLSLVIDIIITFTMGLAVNAFGVQQGPALWRLFTRGKDALTWVDLGIYELRTAALLVALCTLSVICTRLAMGGFLRFTMPAGGNRVTL